MAKRDAEAALDTASDSTCRSSGEAVSEAFGGSSGDESGHREREPDTETATLLGASSGPVLRQRKPGAEATSSIDF